METFSVLTLDLRNPLFYTFKAELDPFQYNPSEGEVLFCFELNPAQYRCFEPEAPYLGALVFKGEAAQEIKSGADCFEIPRGTYLFAQMRELLTQDQWLAMAMDVQQEGLWRRFLPGSRIYVRFLWEHGRGVTQVWRPFTSIYQD
jgi:hypothetical protein